MAMVATSVIRPDPNIIRDAVKKNREAQIKEMRRDSGSVPTTPSGQVVENRR